jgi:hypothetical protein
MNSYASNLLLINCFFSLFAMQAVFLACRLEQSAGGQH